MLPWLRGPLFVLFTHHIIFLMPRKYGMCHKLSQCDWKIRETKEPLAKLFVIPECFYPRYKHSGTDMVFQVVPKVVPQADSPRRTVRTRFPLRIAAGMTELGLLQEPQRSG
jgi:hypothetical protein